MSIWTVTAQGHHKERIRKCFRDKKDMRGDNDDDNDDDYVYFNASKG